MAGLPGFRPLLPRCDVTPEPACQIDNFVRSTESSILLLLLTEKILPKLELLDNILITINMAILFPV